MSAREAKSKAKPATGQVVVHADTAEPVETAFAEVVGLIEQARQRAYQAVDSELVGLYWRIGQYISAKLAAAVWGEGVVDRLAQHLARTMPGQRGFTRRNLFRMRQFYETYSVDKKVTALLTQLPWTRDVIVLTKLGRSENQTPGQCSSTVRTVLASIAAIAVLSKVLAENLIFAPGAKEGGSLGPL